MSQEKIEVNIDGKNVLCDIYFTFVCNQTKKGYIGYTDHSLNQTGEENIFVSTYDPNMGPTTLGEVTEQKEWDLINAIIDKAESLS